MGGLNGDQTSIQDVGRDNVLSLMSRSEALPAAVLKATNVQTEVPVQPDSNTINEVITISDVDSFPLLMKSHNLPI